MTIGLTYNGDLSRVQIAVSDRPNGTVLVQRVANPAATEALWARSVVRGGHALPIVGGVGNLDDFEFFADIPNFYRVTQIGLEDAVDVFTTNGTWNKPPGLTAAKITVVGGGGAGGGATATAAGEASIGNGGAAGVVAVSVIDAATLGASETVTVGAGGTGSAGATGGSAGNSSMGTHVVANGAAGGGIVVASTTGQFTDGTAGPNIGTGQIVVRGQPGGGGAMLPSINATSNVGGQGGSGPFGAGGRAGRGAPGQAAGGWGAGGGGAGSGAGAAARSGGNGTGGIVIIEHIFAD